MEVENFIKKIYHLSQVPIAVFDKQGNLRSKVPMVKWNYSEFEKGKIACILNMVKKQVFCFISYDEKLPMGICGCAGEKFDFILGPFAYGKLDNWEVRNFMKKKKIVSPSYIMLSDVMSVADLILDIFSDNPLDYEALLSTILGQSGDLVNENLVREEIRQFDFFQKNHDYREEEYGLERIISGDIQWIKEHIDELIPSHPIFLDDLVKNEEYIAVIAISLAARAAIQGGLTSQEGFLINDIYLKKLSNCRSVEKMRSVVNEAFLYCGSCVAKKKAVSASNLHVEACKKAIISHKRDKIDLNVIAKESGISKGYMQKLFREYEGISVTEYYLKIKMEAACNLLKYSDRSVGEIAAYLGFGTLSYFSDYFKKRTGLTPVQYRSRNQKTEFKQ